MADSVETLKLKRSALIIFTALILFGTACTAGQPIEPARAQAELMSGISSGVWELSWPQAPIPGPLVARIWRGEAGQERYEILSAPVPSMVGLVYINNGKSAIIYNRLEEDSPVTTGQANLPFSPLSDAFFRIETLLLQTPQSAEREQSKVYQKYTLHYSQDVSLTLYLNPTTNLIVYFHLVTLYDDITLAGRSIEPLINPHPGLFNLAP